MLHRAPREDQLPAVHHGCANPQAMAAATARPVGALAAGCCGCCGCCSACRRQPPCMHSAPRHASMHAPGARTCWASCTSCHPQLPKGRSIAAAACWLAVGAGNTLLPATRRCAAVLQARAASDQSPLPATHGAAANTRAPRHARWIACRQRGRSGTPGERPILHASCTALSGLLNSAARPLYRAAQRVTRKGGRSRARQHHGARRQSDAVKRRRNLRW